MSTRLVGNTHLVAGNAGIIPQILLLLKTEGIQTDGNPDIYVHEYQYFSVDDARAIRERASLRPVGDRRVFVIVAPDMNHNAQNALLKILEEPPADAMFFFVVPAPEMLLPTLRSRAQMLVLDDAGSAEHSIDAKAFLAERPQKRLDMLKPLLEKDEDDKRDIGKIVAFLSALEQRLVKKPLGRNPLGRSPMGETATLGHSPMGEPGEAEALHAIYRARKYIGDKGALVKPLLEQVALLVPKI